MSILSFRRTALAVPFLVCLAVPLVTSSDSPSAPAPAPAANKFIGAAKCKNCHSAADKGDSYGTWSKALHSHAFHALEGDAAKAIATERGLGDPAKADECIRCHTTGHGLPKESFGRGWKPELGVQCETCHGMGNDHMKARFKGAAQAAKGYVELPEGELVASPGVKVCVECHNPQSPSYKPFCYYEFRGQIAHLDPRKPRSDKEKHEYGKCPCGDPCPHGEGCPDGTCNLKPAEIEELRKD